MTITSGKLTVSTEDKEYFTTTARGTLYTIQYNGAEWYVHSDRLALGGRLHNFGSVRHFETLEALESKVKSLRGLGFIINAMKKAG